MIFKRLNIHQFAEMSLLAVNSITGPLLSMKAALSDSSDDYHVGQRFYVEIFHPGRCVFFLEMSLPVKISIAEKIYSRKWVELDRVTRDDCLLEFTRMLASRIISTATGDEKLINTGFPMIVFDEYEDDLEVATSDFYRVDFLLDDAPFSIVICGSC